MSPENPNPETLSSKRVALIVAVVALVAVLCAALYFGWIGHRSVDWNEFKTEFALSRFREVRFKGRKVVAIYRDERESAPLIVYAPTDPLPEIERKWFMLKALKHGVNLVFEDDDTSRTRP